MSLWDCEGGDTTGERGESMLCCKPSRKLVGSISDKACCFQLDLSPPNPSNGAADLSTPTSRIYIDTDQMLLVLCDIMCQGAVIRGKDTDGCTPTMAPKCIVKRLHCAMFVLITSLCLAFSSVDIETVFVLMTSAYSQ